MPSVNESDTNFNSSQPLEGIQVVDLTHAFAGPTCTVLLGDMGADVIKVEPPTGDHFRHPLGGATFINLNRNKRSLVLNLRKTEGKDVVLKLASRADVFVENFVPGAMDRLGLGYDAIRPLNAGIIYCSISGFGQTGPYRDRAAYDPIIQAMSGIMDGTGEPDRPPVRMLPSMIDYSAGLNAALAIVASLWNRNRTGKGERIDISLLDVALASMHQYVTHYKRTGKLPQRAGSGTQQPSWAPYQNFETRDGLILIAVTTDAMWTNLCRILALKELGTNPLYATVQKRSENQEGLVLALNEVTRQYGSEELEAKLLEAGIPCSKVRNVGEMVEDPYVAFRQILEDINHPTMGNVSTVKTPIFFSAKSFPTKRRAPLLGENTHEILRELGYSDQGIQDLIDRGIAFQDRR